MIAFVILLSVCCQAFAAPTSASTGSPLPTFTISTSTVPAGSPGSTSSNIRGGLNQFVDNADADSATLSPSDQAAKVEADRQALINKISNTRGKKLDPSGTNTGTPNKNANARRQRRPRPPKPEPSEIKTTTGKSSSVGIVTNAATATASTVKLSKTTQSPDNDGATVKGSADPVFEKVESSNDQNSPDDSSRAELEDINTMLKQISQMIQRKDGDGDGQNLDSNRLLIRSMQDMLQQMSGGNDEDLGTNDQRTNKDQPFVDNNSMGSPFQANTNPALNKARGLLNPTQRFNNNPFNQNQLPGRRPTQGSSERPGSFLPNRADWLYNKVNPDNTNKTGVKLNKDLDGILYNAREPLKYNMDLLNYFNPIWRHRYVKDPQPALPGDQMWTFGRPDLMQDFYQADMENIYGHRGIFEYNRHFQPKIRSYHQGR